MLQSETLRRATRSNKGTLSGVSLYVPQDSLGCGRTGLVYQPPGRQPAFDLSRERYALESVATASPPSARNQGARSPGSAAMRRCRWMGRIPRSLIPPISAFLSRHGPDDASNPTDPHVVAFRDEHVLHGTGHEVYLADLKAMRMLATALSCWRTRCVTTADPQGAVPGHLHCAALVSQPGRSTQALLMIRLSRRARRTSVGADLDVPELPGCAPRVTMFNVRITFR